MKHFDTVRDLIRQFKGNTYAYGFGVLRDAGTAVSELGQRAVLVAEQVDEYMGRVLQAAASGDLEVIRELVPYSGTNAAG